MLKIKFQVLTCALHGCARCSSHPPLFCPLHVFHVPLSLRTICALFLLSGMSFHPLITAPAPPPSGLSLKLSSLERSSQITQPELGPHAFSLSQHPVLCLCSNDDHFDLFSISTILFLLVFSRRGSKVSEGREQVLLEAPALGIE